MCLPPRTAILLVLLPAIACGPPPQPTSRPAPPAAAAGQQELVGALTLPPSSAGRAALGKLQRDSSSCTAQWETARYLVDIFDWVRLLPHAAETEAAMETLWNGCGLDGEPARGPLATKMVLSAMQQQLRRAIQRCGDEPKRREAARQMVQVLRLDREPRASQQRALQVAVGYRRVARSATAAAATARLRLVDWCAKAFRLAAGGDPDRQHARINQCLLPLFPADPAPYFAADPAERPPDPPWTVVRDRLTQARSSLEQTRLAALARRLAARDKSFFEQAAFTLPFPLRLDAIKLPHSTQGQPFARTPLVVVRHNGFLVGGRAVLSRDERGLVRAIARRLHNDHRRHITVLLGSTQPLDVLLDLARAARTAGAVSMGLGVTRQVAPEAPKGDVQRLVFGGGPVLRLEQLPLSLALLSVSRGSEPSRDLPRGMSFDNRSATAKLGFLVSRDGVQIISRDGRLDNTRLQHLGDKLRLLQRAYPSDRSAMVAVQPQTHYAELVAAVARLQHLDGRPLYSGLALVTARELLLADTQAQLAPVLRVLATARVQCDPALPHAAMEALRGCYQELLRSSMAASKPATPSGTLRLRATAKRRLKLAGGSLRQRTFKRCVAAQLKTVEAPANTRKLELSFSF